MRAARGVDVATASLAAGVGLATVTFLLLPQDPVVQAPPLALAAALVIAGGLLRRRQA